MRSILISCLSVLYIYCRPQILTAERRVDTFILFVKQNVSRQTVDLHEQSCRENDSRKVVVYIYISVYQKITEDINNICNNEVWS